MAPLLLQGDFVPTIDDSDEVSDESDWTPAPTITTNKRKQQDIDPDFEFELEDQNGLEDIDGWNSNHARHGATKTSVDVNDIVSRKHAKRAKLDTHNDKEEKGTDNGNLDDLDGNTRDDEILAADGFGMGAVHEGEEQEDDSDAEGGSDSGSDAGADVDEEQANDPDDDRSSDSGASEAEDEEELIRQKEFFAAETDGEQKSDVSFVDMKISRPILKGLTAAGFNTPTPIQAKTIPVALMGKDVVGGAVTGSGKTAAFLIPILDRLMYRPKKLAVTRIAILMPTRELALQCFNVARKLAAFTDITFAQSIGGLNSREQEKELKKRPDIVIATPGRFIDHMRNSAFAVDTLEILVLDEADRMLEEGFSDELNEILTTIPKSRQTMLFSATMTSKVDDLIRVGLQRPVRIMVDALKSSAAGLVQEFVRLRQGRETMRLGYLMYLCTRIHTRRVIIFFRQKKDAHRVCVVFALCGLKAAELHGNISQDQRIRAIESFRSGEASFLLATDLASRGLDIKGIETVINYEAPQSHEIYLHRVGRTARAGRTGKACTLAAETDRKVVKAAVKAAKKQGAIVQQRSVVPKDADEWQARLDSMEDEIEDVMREVREEKVLQATERDLTRADNIVKHEDEIKSRPKKTWFQTEKEKEESKVKGNVVLNGAATDNLTKKNKERKGKLSNKQKKQLMNKDDRKAGRIWKKRKGDKSNTAKKKK